MAVNSFFHYNTYVLRQFVIVDYCSTAESKIWDVLPEAAISFKGVYFKVCTDGDNKGKIAATDSAYR